MEKFVKAVLEDDDLLIELFKKPNGEQYYFGWSPTGKYSPMKLRDTDPISCLAKFEIPVEEKVRLAKKITL